MKLRAPSVPLITVDPYFTVWLPDETLNFTMSEHWSGKTNSIYGVCDVDGKKYLFFGYHRNHQKMRQVSLDISALSTTVVMECDEITLTAKFTTPVMADNLRLLSRPVSYLEINVVSKDGEEHEIKIDIAASEELCLMKAGQSDLISESISIESTLNGTKFGNAEQKPLNKSGDDICIDWGYFYLITDGKNENTYEDNFEGRDYYHVCADLTEGEKLMYYFAYDDIYSIEYFKKPLKSYWNSNGQTIEQAISEAHREYDALIIKCDQFSEKLYEDALACGGEEYAEILSLAYRQVIAAHKTAVDENGDLLFISKECFSNGCAATVDISYPSMPLFLIYNPELIKGMMRPIYKYALSDAWSFDFAPHDVGQYPLLNGQVYGNNELKWQMPIEECGNMLIMEANVSLATKDASFAQSHIDILEKWCSYLIEFGADPGNQLCTDDFAGHLAHNCNLSLKAVMGIQGMSYIMDMLGNTEKAEYYRIEAKKMAELWKDTAIDTNGTTKLAFDLPNTFSMKYNMVWDKVWNSNLFGQELMDRELENNMKHFNKFGMPLDIRADYTKTDWLVWVAAMSSSKEVFKKFILPMYKAYNESPSRVPLTDWYDTVSGRMVSFKHRAVQGGLYIKLLIDKF